MAKVIPLPTHSPRSEDLGDKVKAHQRYRLKDGSIVPGVTTITGILGFNKQTLINWARNEALAGRDPNKIKDETAMIGTLAHYLIECGLSGKPPSTKDYTPDQVERAEHALHSFNQWISQHELAPMLIEGQLVSEEHQYGGTIDCWAHLDDVPTLLDFKTSSGVWLEHKIQVAAYWKLLQENGYDVKGVRILRIPRVPQEDFGEHILSGQQILIGWRMFKRALELYRLERELRGSFA